MSPPTARGVLESPAAFVLGHGVALTCRGVTRIEG